MIPIHVSDEAEPGTIYFVVPRKSQIVRWPDGSEHKIWLESEEEWARKCAVIRNLKLTP